ncbi:hypothetical protein [Roseivirga sp.]|uniref:hypothetical protein n=1 Tax=Roseivirga sp. TaxID=1964215 RepID=UPI003B8E2DCF
MRFRILIAICFLSLLFGCNPDKKKQVDQSAITFKTDDASNLFFKNVRQFYYEVEEMEAAKLNIFRLKKRELSNDQPVINLAIVNNWRYDEAYLLLEPNGVVKENESLEVKWRNPNGESGEIQYANGNKTEQVAFADGIYAQIQQGSTFTIKVQEEWKPFLDLEKTREAFRITVFDYYKLVKRI